MAFANLSRPGQVNSSGDDLALFLKLFSGEVLTSFHTDNVMLQHGMVRTISQGKSAQFPVLGKASARWHSAGDSLLEAPSVPSIGAEYLSKIPHNEIEVFVDDPTIATTMVASIDEMRNHYDIRAMYAAELGEALSLAADVRCLAVLLDAAEDSTENVTGSGAIAPINFGGGGAAGAYSAANFEAFCFDAQAQMDLKRVPKAGRKVVIRPDLYYAFIESGSKQLSKDYVGMNGDVSQAIVYRCAGLEIVKCENLGNLTTDLSAQVDAGSKNGSYGRDWRDVGAIAFHQSSYATVKMAELSTESEWLIERQSNLVVSKFVMGHKAIRPESAVVGRVSSLTLA